VPLHRNKLENQHRGEILKLLLTDLPSNLFLIDILLDRGVHKSSHEEWWGAFIDKQLVGIVVSFGRPNKGQPARLIVACGEAEACSFLGEKQEELGGTEMIIGERVASDALCTQLDLESIRICYDQQLYHCTSIQEVEPYPIRFAKEKDFESLLLYSAQMIKEDLKYDPQQQNPDRFAASVRSKILRNKCIVAEYDDQICYTIDIGTQFRLGCQLGGTFVPPKFRGRGISTKATAAVCQLILKSSDCVTMHVHEKNIPAIRCYERIGLQATTPFRLISFKGSHHAP
jgi:RimJ/RimL family protein N-acetyltransferase